MNTEGSVTAEVAIVTPAVLLIIAGVGLGLAALGHQSRLNSAVHSASRWVAAGNPDEAQQQLRRSLPTASISYTSSAGQGCLHATTDVPMLVTVAHLEARECVNAPPPV